MLIAAGFTRFSLGIQDFDEKVLKAVNRDPSAIPPADLFRYIKSRKESISVNFDFIYGLPGQTASSFTGTLNKAAEIKPDRLVTFSYAHVPWLKKHQLILEKRGLPASSEKMEMFLTGYSILKNAGYKPQIGSVAPGICNRGKLKSGVGLYSREKLRVPKSQVVVTAE
jgi:oxygen-independent coproporphyrinogen-3 oxidase